MIAVPAARPFTRSVAKPAMFCVQPPNLSLQMTCYTGRALSQLRQLASAVFDRTCPKSKTYAKGGGGAGAAAEQLAFTTSVLGAFCAGQGSPPNVLGVVGTWHSGLPTQILATVLLTVAWPQTTNESSRIKSRSNR